MAELTERQLATVAGGAIAAGAWCGAAAGSGAGIGALDVPSALLAVALVAGAVLAGTRKSTRVLPAGKDVVVLTAVTVAGFMGLYLAGWTNRAHVTEIARLLPLAVVALTVLWPEPNVLRYSLLLTVGTLLGSYDAPVASHAAVGGAVVAIAVALVSSHRLTTATAPRLGGSAPGRRRRAAGEALAVLAVVGLLAALASSLLPPPPGQGGGPGDGRGALPSPAAPPLGVADPFEIGPGPPTPGRIAGRPTAGEDVVFLIASRQADMWRATTYDRWDGEAWSRSFDTLRLIDDNVVAPGTGDAQLTSRSRTLTQSVVVLARSTVVVVAAARPTFASARVGLRQGADATLTPRSPLSRGDRYVVVSDGSQAGAGVLRALGDISPAAVPGDVASAYLQLPQVSSRVRALAADVVAGMPTTYAKVRAVERWIDDHTDVTVAPTPLAAGADPLEDFLFERRSGPAERAATSMAVMLRASGIPARMVVGFLPGTRTGPDRQFLVRSRHSHAWVEVWFPAVGWQRFDPTGLAPDAHTGESVWDRLQRFLGRLWPLVVLILVAAAAWLVRAGVRWRRRRASLPWATRFFARVERAGAARGRPRRPEETPIEYADELADGVLPHPRLAEVGQLVTVAAWSRHEPEAQDRARAEQVLREATKAAPARRLRRRSRRAPRSQPARGPTIPRP